MSLMWPSASPNSVGAPDKIDFAAPVNASPAALRLHSHDLGSGWVAIPFLWDSFLPCSMPVYPGALGVVPKNHVCPSKGGGPQKPRDIQSRVLRDRSSCSMGGPSRAMGGSSAANSPSPRSAQRTRQSVASEPRPDAILKIE